MGQTEYQIFIVLATLILLIFIGGIIVFITQYHKKKLEDALEKDTVAQAHAREVLHVKLEIQLDTMKDIGRDLHDNIGQQLILATQYMNLINSRAEKQEILNSVANISAMLTATLADLRNISQSMLNEKGDVGYLDDLVKDQCSKINMLGTCNVTCTFSGEEIDTSATIKNFILRIIQEFIQNSLKHSGCKNISITAEYLPQGLQIHINDDGAGFDMAAALSRGEGVGLSNMKKRAAMIGATFTQSSAPGKGTRVDLFIPVNKLKVS